VRAVGEQRAEGHDQLGAELRTDLKQLGAEAAPAHVGSSPSTSTTSRTLPGRRQTEIFSIGELIRRAAPSTSETVGRVTWNAQ